jgi:hypothetical protein
MANHFDGAAGSQKDGIKLIILLQNVFKHIRFTWWRKFMNREAD